MPGVPIIDCLFSVESMSRERIPEPNEIAREMDRAAIDRVLLTPCRRWRCERHWGPDGISLCDVNALVTALPQRFTGLAGYDPYAIPESMALIELAIENDYRGVYVQTEGSEIGVAESRFYPLYKKCESSEIPVIVQVGVSVQNIAAPEDLATVADNFPSLKLIAGVSGAIDLPAVLSLCERYENVYFAFDGSLLFPDDIRRFRNSETALRRAMFGSNGCRWLDLIDSFARIELPFEFMRAFLHDNAAAVLNMEVREEASIG
jgi:uncharacterized protein